jgi:hypothetical protein
LIKKLLPSLEQINHTIRIRNYQTAGPISNIGMLVLFGTYILPILSCSPSPNPNTHAHKIGNDRNTFISNL